MIDTLTIRGDRWIVRSYFEPAGRSRARYNFERFSADGRVQAYVSLESADAFREEAPSSSVIVGPVENTAGNAGGLALNWYDGKSHGTIATYATEPTYEVARASFLKWARQQGRGAAPVKQTLHRKAASTSE